LPGICARVLFADEIKKDPNVAFPKLIAEILPHGLLGIVVAAMLAAIMSSLASVFNRYFLFCFFSLLVLLFLF
jgi:Na+/proline symporter